MDLSFSHLFYLFFDLFCSLCLLLLFSFSWLRDLSILSVQHGFVWVSVCVGVFAPVVCVFVGLCVCVFAVELDKFSWELIGGWKILTCGYICLKHTRARAHTLTELNITEYRVMVMWERWRDIRRGENGIEEKWWENCSHPRCSRLRERARKIVEGQNYKVGERMETGWLVRVFLH